VGEEFDYIVHVGDITNACIDGMDEGEEQLEAVLPLFEELSSRGELLYVWGNRDFEVCIKGGSTRIDEYADFEFTPGTHIPTEGAVEVAGQRFTQDRDEVDEQTILVTHHFGHKLLDHFSGILYLSGHVHVGRFKNNVLNTGFLYRDESHGANPIEGGYFVVEITDGSIDVKFESLGGLEKGICASHISRGVQFTPTNWRSACKFCYDSEDFYTEVVDSIKYDLEEQNISATSQNIIDLALETYGSGVPRNFEEELSTFVTDRTESNSYG
jgi:predicted phosphodiesterase